MKNQLLRIKTRFSVNKGDTRMPFWKTKGVQEFELEVNESLVLDNRDLCRQVIEKFLQKESNDKFRYTLNDFELVFRAPKKLDSLLFALELGGVVNGEWSK